MACLRSNRINLWVNVCWLTKAAGLVASRQGCRVSIIYRQPSIFERMTCDEVAKILGVSRVRVMQIEKRALEKLRIGLAKRGVRLEDVRAIPPAAENEFPFAGPKARQHRFEARAG